MLAGETVTDAAVAPLIGFVVVPDAPMYHWYVSGASPVARTESVTDLPAVDDIDDGCAVIDGAAHPLCVIVMVTPATMSVPVRAASLSGATENAAVPLPLPFAPEVIVIQVAVVEAVQLQESVEVTATDPVPPLLSNVNDAGVAVNWQPTLTVAVSLSTSPQALLTSTQ